MTTCVLTENLAATRALGFRLVGSKERRRQAEAMEPGDRVVSSEHDARVLLAAMAGRGAAPGA